MANGLGVTRLFGVFLGLAGALLDFYSGYLFLTPSVMGGPIGGTAANLAWGVGVSVLGVVLLVTAVASARPLGRLRMKTFGEMMALLGIMMLLIGASMYFGATPMMTGATLSGIGMLAVGTLMLANGSLMSRSRAMMSMESGTVPPMKTIYLTILGVLIVGAGLVGVLSLVGSAGTGTVSTSTTSSNTSAAGSFQVSTSAASCSWSGTYELCTVTLTNTGSTGTAITGAGTLSYNGAGAMGMNDVSTSNGCTVLSGSLGQGQSEQVRCAFTVNRPASSGMLFSGNVDLVDGGSVPFSGAAT